jgi:phosphate transport system substrate-binding protein
MINAPGKTVQPELASFQAAAAGADWGSVPGFGVVLTEQKGDASWPITGATFILIHKQPANADQAAAALKFFDWALTKGDKMAAELDYVPMPDAVVKKIEAEFLKVVGADGKPLFKK